MRLTQGIHRARQIAADRTALLGPGVSRTWAEFAERVARLAGGLRQLGLTAGDCVAVFAGNTPEFVESYFGILWAGGVLVPVNTRWSVPEIRHCLADAEPRIILAEPAYLPMIRDATESMPPIVILGEAPGAAAVTYEGLIAGSPAVPDAMRQGDDLACLFYTGGTTGRSKGVMLTHNNFLANTFSALPNLGIGADTVHLHISPLFHVAGGSRVFSTTVAGATHAVLPQFDPEAFLEAIERYRVTVTVIVPTMLNRLLQLPDFGRYDLSSLKLLSYGASPMPESLLRQARARLPGVGFLNSYGMTELSPVATMLLPHQHDFEGPGQHRLRSAGQAVFNADVAVLDADDRPLPAGVVGEICVRGPMVMAGYWGLPELTAEALRGGWMHTGDAGYLDEEGFLYLVDRVKDMIVTGGENVYSAAVENVLYSYPGVRECAVIGIPSDEWGEAVHAIVVPKDGVTLSEAALIEHCRKFLAGYECPKQVEFRSAELPKSGAGKILKAELKQPFWAGQDRSIH